MSKKKVCITFTEPEITFLTKKGGLRNKTLYKLLQSDINRMFGGININTANCGEGNERIKKTYDIPPRLWPVVICISKKMRLTPSQLIYRVIVAPYLIEMIAESKLISDNIPTTTPAQTMK